MKLIRTIYTLGLLVGLFASCSKESPLDGEQYYKQVYIVGAYEVVQQFDVAYGDGPQNAYVAVATGGSQNIDRNVEVVLTHNDATIEWYNNKYMLDAPLKYHPISSLFLEYSRSLIVSTRENTDIFSCMTEIIIGQFCNLQCQVIF